MMNVERVSGSAIVEAGVINFVIKSINTTVVIVIIILWCHGYQYAWLCYS